MKKLLMIIIILAAVIAGGFYFGKDYAVKKASEYVLEKKLVDKAKEYGYSEQEVQEILNKVSEEDKQKVQEIIENHVGLDTVTEMINGDPQTIKDKAMDMITDSEKSELEDMYNKYSGLIKK